MGAPDDSTPDGGAVHLTGGGAPDGERTPDRTGAMHNDRVSCSPTSTQLRHTVACRLTHAARHEEPLRLVGQSACVRVRPSGVSAWGRGACGAHRAHRRGSRYVRVRCLVGYRCGRRCGCDASSQHAWCVRMRCLVGYRRGSRCCACVRGHARVAADGCRRPAWGLDGGLSAVDADVAVDDDALGSGGRGPSSTGASSRQRPRVRCR